MCFREKRSSTGCIYLNQLDAVDIGNSSDGRMAGLQKGRYPSLFVGRQNLLPIPFAKEEGQQFITINRKATQEGQMVLQEQSAPPWVLNGHSVLQHRQANHLRSGTTNSAFLFSPPSAPSSLSMSSSTMCSGAYLDEAIPSSLNYISPMNTVLDSRSNLLASESNYPLQQFELDDMNNMVPTIRQQQPGEKQQCMSRSSYMMHQHERFLQQNHHHEHCNIPPHIGKIC